MILLRSTAIYFATLLLAVVYWIAMIPPLLIVLCLPTRSRQHWLRVMLLGFGLATVRIAWRPFFDVEFRDLTGGVRTPGIVVVNHRAATDAFLAALPRLNAAQTVNGWPMRLPILGTMARLAGYLDITGWDYATLKRRVSAVAGQGDMIVSYPEGTRSEGKRMNPFHSGMFRVARELGLPIYMLCIAGNQYMPDRKFRFREFGRVLVRFVGPLPAEETKNCASAYILKKRVFRRMETELAAMDGELEDEETF